MLHNEPLAEVADALRDGRMDVTAYVEQLEQRAADVEPRIESLVPEEGRWERLRAAAAELADRYPEPSARPPLYGVPIGVKDIFHVDGLPTRAGSDLPPETLEGPESAAVTVLRRAGALVLGKTVTTEFAHMDPGPTRNPHDLDHTPGGSSSGSAAAVAAGLCPFAFGSQTIGSVIRPAAFCGIVGYKPTYDRIPTDGVIPLSTSVDHVGAFTQDTDGIALVAPLLCDSWQYLPPPSRLPTIGVPDGRYLKQASETALDAFETHLDVLGAAGYDLVRVDALEAIAEINDRHEQLVAADAALAHESWFGEYGERYADATRQLILEGLEIPVKTVATGRRSRTEVRSDLTALMDRHGIDVWIAPAAPGPAPESIESTGDPVMNLPWTHTGLPTITVPASKTDDGLPLGVQFAGRFGADEDVVRWSHGIADTLRAHR